MLISSTRGSTATRQAGVWTGGAAAGFFSSAMAAASRSVGRTPTSAPAVPSQSKSRRESTGLVSLAAASIPSRRRQKALSSGFPPTSIDVAQGPKECVMAMFLSGTGQSVQGSELFGWPFS